MRLIQSMKSSIWLVVTPAAGPSPDRLPTMSTGPGATGRCDAVRRMVVELDADDDADGDIGLRRTIAADVRRRIDGAGSKPFSSIRAMSSALIESDDDDPLVDRRAVFGAGDVFDEEFFAR